MPRFSRREAAFEPPCATARSPAAPDGTPGPSLYSPEFVAVVRNAAELGATHVEIAEALRVSKRTLYNWAELHPEFAAVLKVDRMKRRSRPETALELAGVLAWGRAAADGAGRAVKYRPELTAVARQAAELGGTQAEIAEAMGICTSTLYSWAVRHAELATALKVGKAAADDRVERALYHRAVGYTEATVKLTVRDGEVVATPVVEHHPPDVRAAMMWLKNRRPKEWREKHVHEVSTPEGAPLPALRVVFVAPDEDLGREKPAPV